MNALEPGATLGSYRILARLRAGAMGVLYLARRSGSSGFARPVAIKVIHDHLAQNKRFVRMFVDEAKVSAFIDDPHVVRVEAFGQDQGRYFLVMEYVDGASLAQVIGVLRKRGRIPVEIAVAIAMQLTAGLHGAHEATDERGQALGIVHRDVSPHNVLVSWNGYVRVIDFGIAKAKQVGGQTKTGSLRGKLAYMPPEQARSARTVDRRADLYGVGLVLWEMLTFRRVFDADTDIAILNQIRDPQIDPPSRHAPNIPKALDDIVMRTLATEPNERPATGAALRRMLAEAVPQALLVLPGDIAAMMKKVRTAADASDGGSDDAAVYSDELKRTGATFAGNMQESVEQGGATAPRLSSSDLMDISEDDKTEATASPVVTPPPPPPSIRERPVPIMTPPPGSVKVQPPPRAFVKEDETTLRRDAPMRPHSSSQNVAVRPADGVRALAPSVPEMPSHHTPPPISSSRNPVLRPSLPSAPSLIAPVPATSSPNLAPQVPNAQTSTPNLYAPGVAAESAPSLVQRLMAAPPRTRLMLFGAPIVLAIVVAVVIVTSAPSSASAPSITLVPQPVKPSAAPPPSPSLIAPVVIAPPITEEAADAGVAGRGPKTRSSAK